MQLRPLIALIIVLSIFSIPPAADASEVVKLARLVLTGKRVAAEPHREAAPAVPADKQPTVVTPAPDAAGLSATEAPSSTLSAGASSGSPHNQTFLRPF